MKVYPNLVQALVSLLKEIFMEHRQANKVVEQALNSNPKWGGRDRRFIADNTYNVVRWYRLYREILGYEAVTSEDWLSILGIQWITQGEDIHGIDQFKHLIPSEILAKKNDLFNSRKIRESIPDWLDEIGEKELGNEWTEILSALNQSQKVCLRVNTLKTTVLDLQQELLKNNIESEILLPNALILVKKPKLIHLESFKNGSFEIQDYNSQLIAPFLQLKPGLKVIDACAGAGGKTLHIAELMRNQGEIISLDIHEHKLSELKKRANRMGVNCIKTKLIRNQSVINSFKESADRLLLDVPCSGLGVLRRNPDAKWKLNPEFLLEIKAIQQNILSTYSTMLKPGGKMVYATCSILPSENQDQVSQFLNSPAGNNFILIKQKTTFPTKDGFDGFYMALMEKHI